MDVHHQQHHINKLLNTAATGTGIINDVDALLTPIHAVTPPPLQARTSQQHHQQQQQSRSQSRPERNLWRTDEILQMLNYMQKTNAIELLNDKTIKSERVFGTIEKLMHKSGYKKKTHLQIWTKWKFLKSTYTTSKRNGILPKMIPYAIYEILDKMLGRVVTTGGSGRASGGGGGSVTSSAGGGGAASEYDNSMSSLDGDNSNCGRILISGVEGGLANGDGDDGHGGDRSSTYIVDEEDDNNSSFGMAHPIFGFRLGLVKQEPMDTGYETITPNDIATHDNELFDDTTANSSLTNAPFQAEIKQEIEDVSDSPPPASSPASSPLLQEATTSPNLTIRRHKLNATHEVSMPSQQQHQQQHQRLPPLRIAPFAKAPNIAIQSSFDRSPPPLSLHPATRQAIRISNAHSSKQSSVNTIIIDNNNSNMSRKILPKSQHLQQSHVPTSIHLPKDITIHSRATSSSTGAAAAAAAAMPSVPHVKLMSRKLQPPSSPPLLKRLRTYHEEPMINTATVSNSNLRETKNGKRRRLEIPWTSNESYYSATKRLTQMKVQHYQDPYLLNDNKNNDSDDDDDNDDDDGGGVVGNRHHGDSNAVNNYDNDSGNSIDDNIAAQRKSFARATQQHNKQQSPPLRGNKAQQCKEQELFESALKDLSTSMRQMQRDLIKDFFAKQMELVRKEHEFQMQQDSLIMQAFQEQSEEIMQSAKSLLGLDGDAPTARSTTSEQNDDEIQQNNVEEQIQATDILNVEEQQQPQNEIQEVSDNEDGDDNGDEAAEENDNKNDEDNTEKQLMTAHEQNNNGINNDVQEINTAHSREEDDDDDDAELADIVVNERLENGNENSNEYRENQNDNEENENVIENNNSKSNNNNNSIGDNNNCKSK